MAGTRRKWSVGLWLGGLAVGVVAVHWGWVEVWWDVPDLSAEQRTGHFNEAFVDRPRRAVAARLDGGGMAILARSDIAQVGASRCIRESECSEAFVRTSRRSIGCAYVRVRFYCAYAVRTTDGNAGTAFARIYSNPGKPLQVEQPSIREANEMECKLGFGCKPAAGAEPGGPAGASARKVTDPAPPPPHEAAACKGVRAEVVGAGETCLDPGDPARREFRDCNNGFCGPAMVALPKGRGMRGSSAADMARLSKDDPQAELLQERDAAARGPDRISTGGRQIRGHVR